MVSKSDKLVVEVNRSQAKSGAWFMGILLLFMFISIFYLAVFEKVDWGGPMTWFFCTLMFGWVFCSFINSTLSLIKLSRHIGPLIEINSTGNIDYWHQPSRVLLWQDIKYSKWQIYQSVSRTLIIMPRKRSAKEIIGGWFGSLRLRYPHQYLSVPDHEIAKFMIKYAPEGLLR